MIIFDFDGTLYRTHETSLPAFREVCKKYNIPLTGEGERYMLYTTTDSFLHKYAPYVTAETRAALKSDFQLHEIAAVRECGRLFDGVRELLEMLDADGIDMVICGMGRKDYINTALEHCGIAHLFKAVYHRVEGLSKGQVMKKLLSDFELDSTECLMVGDSITDITAARENDVPFIGVTYGYGANDIANADILTDDVPQLQAAIYRALVFSRIEREIKTLPRPLVLGVNGIDTSGKTVFASSLADYLHSRGIPATIINLDDFHNPRDIRYTDMSPRGYTELSFNWEKVRILVEALKRGEPVSAEAHDVDTDSYFPEDFEVTESSVIIVEGVLLYRPPLEELFDYRVFLEISTDEALRRATLRDVPKYGEEFLQKYTDRYIPAHVLYVNEHKPAEKCNIVIDNNDFRKPIIK